MNQEQANALLITLASKYLLNILPDEAVAELDSVILSAESIVQQSDELKKWQDKIVILEHWEGVLAEIDRQEKTEILNKLKQALFQERKISFNYKDRETTDFNPFGLAARDKHIYLIGSYGYNKTPYLLSLRNITHIKILNTPSVLPLTDFSLKSFAEEKLNFFNPDDTLENVVIEFPMEVYSYVKNNHPKAEAVKFIENKEFFQFKAEKINNNKKFHQWLLGFQNKAHVIEPFELRKIINHAEIDELTNLYNRKSIDRLIKREIEHCYRHENNYFSILMTDIDKFKNINDTYGHGFGDKVLQLFAKCLRDYDAIRMGGEEFLVVLPQTHADEAFLAAERVRKALADIEIDSGQGVVKVTTSVGIAEFPIHLSDDSLNMMTKSNKRLAEEYKEKLYLEIEKKADTALYIAKDSGRNKSLIFKTEYTDLRNKK